MTDSLREWSDRCEERALDALDSTADLTSRELLEVAMLLDQRADYLDARGRVVDAEVVETRVKELLGILERIDDACREVTETHMPSSPEALLASDIRDLTRDALK